AASIRVIRTGGWVRPARTALLSAISTYPFSHPVSHLRAAGRWPFDAAARQGRDRVGLEADVLLGARAIAVASLSVYNHNHAILEKPGAGLKRARGHRIRTDGGEP